MADKVEAKKLSQKLNKVKTRTNNQLKKITYVILGSLFMALAFLGLILPLLPTTPFLLLASYFYLRSSKKLHRWLLDNKIFGKYLSDYQKSRSIPNKIKIIVLVILWITILSTILFFLDNFIIRVLLVLIAILVSIHILRLKSSSH